MDDANERGLQLGNRQWPPPDRAPTPCRQGQAAQGTHGRAGEGCTIITRRANALWTDQAAAGRNASGARRRACRSKPRRQWTHIGSISSSYASGTPPSAVGICTWRFRRLLLRSGPSLASDGAYGHRYAIPSWSPLMEESATNKTGATQRIAAVAV